MKNLKEIEIVVLPILRKHEVVKAGFFGSYVRGEENNESDVDILVELKKELSLLDVIGIKIELERVIRKKVDLVEYDTIRPELKEIILREEVPLEI